MTTAKVDFSSVDWRSVEWTNLVTLYLRAYESRSPRTILGDRAAADAVDRINYDFKRIHRAAQPWGNQFLVALRAKKLDVWTADFMRRHPGRRLTPRLRFGYQGVPDQPAPDGAVVRP
jgi:O-methyltransferase involved in polyketide biosynthesis